MVKFSEDSYRVPWNTQGDPDCASLSFEMAFKHAKFLASCIFNIMNSRIVNYRLEIELLKLLIKITIPVNFLLIFLSHFYCSLK